MLNLSTFRSKSVCIIALCFCTKLLVFFQVFQVVAAVNKFTKPLGRPPNWSCTPALSPQIDIQGVMYCALTHKIITTPTIQMLNSSYNQGSLIWSQVTHLINADPTYSNKEQVQRFPFSSTVFIKCNIELSMDIQNLVNQPAKARLCSLFLLTYTSLRWMFLSLWWSSMY